MYVTGDTIIRFATVLGALGTLGALLLATLDGLKQLGANGNVSDAYQRLEKHLNQSAHE